MIELTEDSLRLSVPDEFDAKNFDDSSHGLAHCMKAVDFVIEIPSHILFLEFKDPDHPRAQEKAKKKFLAESTDRYLTDKLKLLKDYKETLKSAEAAFEERGVDGTLAFQLTVLSSTIEKIDSQRVNFIFGCLLLLAKRH